MEYDRCKNCDGEVTTDSDFCPHCGVLFQGIGTLRCDTHVQRISSGVCVICRKVVCIECSKTANGRTLCLDHHKIEIQQDWARVFQSTEISDSELVRAVLESEGFHIQVQNFTSMGFVWDGGGDSPISRSNISRPAKVFVPIPEYIGAAKTIEEWSSSEIEPEERSAS
ncbi:MAG: B box-type domain-containing protein [Bacteroidetes bacterium]|nr:B box-type domain-containing protein [Bacteroidota bacterium]